MSSSLVHGEIYIQTVTAIASYKQLLSVLGDEETHNSRYVWFSLTSFLTHTAMVSKFFDPIGPDELGKRRSEALRVHLNVGNDSPILSRFARNNLEHFDERIDNWVKSKSDSILEMVFDDREGFDFINEGKPAIRRVLIADEMVFISEDKFGKHVEMQLSIAFDALVNLHSACSDKLANESPHHYRLAQALRDY